MPAGRPTNYTPELADEICEKIALGGNLNRICAEESMPSHETVYRWRRTMHEFQEKYLLATQERSYARAERIDDWKDQVAAGTLKPEAANVIINAEKWQAGRENPKRFGEKIQHSGDETSPLKIIIERHGE